MSNVQLHIRWNLHTQKEEKRVVMHARDGKRYAVSHNGNASNQLAQMCKKFNYEE